MPITILQGVVEEPDALPGEVGPGFDEAMAEIESIDLDTIELTEQSEEDTLFALLSLYLELVPDPTPEQQEALARSLSSSDEEVAIMTEAITKLVEAINEEPDDIDIDIDIDSSDDFHAQLKAAIDGDDLSLLEDALVDGPVYASGDTDEIEKRDINNDGQPDPGPDPDDLALQDDGEPAPVLPRANEPEPLGNDDGDPVTPTPAATPEPAL